MAQIYLILRKKLNHWIFVMGSHRKPQKYTRIFIYYYFHIWFRVCKFHSLYGYFSNSLKLAKIVEIKGQKMLHI
jgi:hypothetical protein